MMANISDKGSTMTISLSDAIRILRERINNPRYNTSYPISPSDWYKYNTVGRLPFDSDKSIAFYLHIPFCKRLCSFCEYSRTILPPADLQTKYLKTLHNDIIDFISKNAHLRLYGLDLGGGTPTALNNQSFADLMDIYREVTGLITPTSDYEPSIEGTFDTLSPHKAKLIVESGIQRLSLGVQSSSKSVLAPLNRRADEIGSMHQVMDLAHNAGIQKINLDLMYGLPGQSLESIKEDIRIIECLQPEQVTVYELRTNQLPTAYNVNAQLSYDQYCILFDELTGMGYAGQFGQNTFSLNPEDKGLSSYLRHRMFDGRQYKGFGLSAQSMSDAGLSYNICKGVINSNQISEAPTYESVRHYALPREEIFAKYVAISGYSGGISLSSSRRIYGSDFDARFGEIIAAFEKEGLWIIANDRLQMTRKGYRYYGALLSMFYT